MDNTPINKYQDEGEKALQQEKLYEEIYQSFKNNKQVQDYYKGYNPESVDEMIREHARSKIFILEHGPGQVKRQETKELMYADEAMQCLKEIQQKKLFDLQCQWRAELITLEGVEITDDFDVIAGDILNCKLISPVSEADLDMYLNFLINVESEGVAYHMPDFGWQMYVAFKIALEGKHFAFIGFPDWYYYHNLCTGNSKYLILPDIRGKKEHYYRNLEYQTNNPVVTEEEKVDETDSRDQAIAKNLKKQEPELVPSLYFYSPGVLSAFVHKFESKTIQREFRAAGGEMLDDEENEYNDDRIYTITHKLADCGEILSVEAGSNWGEQIHKTLIKYQVEKQKEAIAPAYEQYCMFIENGISFEKEDKFNMIPSRNRSYAQILKGRKFAGEPEDLNF